MRLVALTISLLFALSVHAQLETGNWFLNGSRISVTPGGVAQGQPAPPATFKVAQTSASISDASGALLFATNGSTIIDRDMAEMPAMAGRDLGGADGKTLIHRIPGSTRYLVFYHVGNNDDTKDNMSWTLKYAIVDMSLNGGKGDVTTMNQPIEVHSSPSYTLAEGGNDGEAWLVTHRMETDSFRVYKIDAAGLSAAPVISKAGNGRNMLDYHYWDLKASFDGKLVAGIVFRNNTRDFVVATWHMEVMSFDAATGRLYSNMSSQSELSYIFTGMSLEFSPDSRLLYSVMVQRLPDYKPCGFASDAIRQYQLCHTGTRDLGSFSHILYADFNECAPKKSFGRIVLGADKQMHIPFSGDRVSIIKYPNKIWNDCGFVLDGYRAPAFNDSLPGTPQFDPTLMKWAVQNNIVYDGGCMGSLTQFKVTNSRVSGHRWDFGDPSSASNSSTVAEPFHHYMSAGKYRVTLRMHDDVLDRDIDLEDSVEVVDPGQRILTGYPHDTTMCTPGTEPYVVRPRLESSLMRWYQMDGDGKEYNVQHSDTIAIAKSGTWFVELERNNCLGCRKIDSIYVELKHTDYTPLRDTVICAGETLVLGMPDVPDATIRWSTGDATFRTKVTAPGTVSLQLTMTTSGCVLVDTLQVAGNGDVLGNMPADTTVCAGEPLLLRASSATADLRWQDGRTGSSYEVGAPGLYWVAATGAGCTARDSITVHHRPVEPLHLDEYVSVCKGDSVPVDAGPGFLSYQWSTGETGSSIFISQQGGYSVAALNANGCYSRDTVIMLAPNDPPVVDLGPSGPVCLGVDRVLDAGPGMSTYAWSTGATTRTTDITAPGSYSVRVTDGRGCSASASVNITEILDAPQVTLPPEMAICKYKSVTISAPEGYAGYAWSTGSTQTSVKLDRDGVYWLRVTDANGCVGSDTIRVSYKDCYGGVQVPNAFTPGHDGLNDRFRPVFDGSMVEYRFMVYDRYGECVFSSTDQLASWDGTHGGKQLPTGTYAWVFRYKRAGEAAVTEKGTVMLIR